MLEALFDPREKSPLQVVVSLNDPDYCETKAIEMISEAKLVLIHAQPHPIEAADTEVQAKLMEEYKEKIVRAMSLLALSMVQRNGPA